MRQWSTHAARRWLTRQYGDDWPMTVTIATEALACDLDRVKAGHGPLTSAVLVNAVASSRPRPDLATLVSQHPKAPQWWGVHVIMGTSLPRWQDNRTFPDAQDAAVVAASTAFAPDTLTTMVDLSSSQAASTHAVTMAYLSNLNLTGPAITRLTRNAVTNAAHHHMTLMHPEHVAVLAAALRHPNVPATLVDSATRTMTDRIRTGRQDGTEPILTLLTDPDGALMVAPDPALLTGLLLAASAA